MMKRLCFNELALFPTIVERRLTLSTSLTKSLSLGAQTKRMKMTKLCLYAVSEGSLIYVNQSYVVAVVDVVVVGGADEEDEDDEVVLLCC